MVPKANYSRGIYDIIYFESEKIQQSLIEKIFVVHCMKTTEFKSLEEITKIIKSFSIY
jgi:hypothetical protein